MKIQIQDKMIVGFNKKGSLHFKNIPDKWFSDDLPPIVDIGCIKLVEAIVRKADDSLLLSRYRMVFDFSMLDEEFLDLIKRNILLATERVKTLNIKSVNNNIILYK